MPTIEPSYSGEEREHRIGVFGLEQSLRSDSQVLRQIATALKDQTEHAPWVRFARPIIEPRDDGRFDIRLRRKGRVRPSAWPVTLPTFESIAERLLLMREHDRHIKPREGRRVSMSIASMSVDGWTP